MRPSANPRTAPAAWRDCSNLLIIRPDNMGDLLMSAPAIRALKQFIKKGKITLLTAEQTASAADLLPYIDETLVANLPWVKQEDYLDPGQFSMLVDQLKQYRFDGCVIFTVYSQNPLPAAMLAWMAGIPLRLAYCRENPYQLLSHWVPDDEPYSQIRHQVVRDLELVRHIGAEAVDDRIVIQIPTAVQKAATEKLAALGVDVGRPFLVFHAGVSEPRRAFPTDRWVALAKRLLASQNTQLLFTGKSAERQLTDYLEQTCGDHTFSVAGLLDIMEFAAVVQQAALVVSVNTATVHLAAATGTPCVVFYAQTNPQHTPWKNPHIIFPFSLPDGHAVSRNEVVRHVARQLYRDKVPLPALEDVLDAIESLLVKRCGGGQLRHQVFFH